MTDYRGSGFAQYIHLPIDISGNFSIETIIDFKSGDDDSGHGLIWGFKDWDNYYFFIINQNGCYSTGGINEGIAFIFKKWEKSSNLKLKTARNLIKINKIQDKLIFSINGQIVESEDFYKFRGNYVGFLMLSGKKQVLFEELVVRQDLIDNALASMSSTKSEWKGNGTGFFIDPRGYIATNFHVIEGSSEIQVEFIQMGQRKSYKAKIISGDKQNDLAILKVDDPKFKSFTRLPFSFKTEISDVGASVFALGYPLALNIMGEEIKFTDGKISSRTGFQGDIDSYQISVPIQPGNSGGPLFDYNGNVIGIISAKIMGADNVTYAIKSSNLYGLVEVMPENLILPNDVTIASKSLTEKVKILSDYVVMIKIR